jgi:hypothetical protein
MREAVSAYKSVTVSPEFYEIERLREKSRHNEASALYRAEEIGAEKKVAEIAKRMQEYGLSPDLMAKILMN